LNDLATAEFLPVHDLLSGNIEPQLARLLTRDRYWPAVALNGARIAAEKIIAGMIQGLIAAAFVLPIARLVMGPIPALTLSHAGEVLLVGTLGSMAFSSLGMWLGTAIAPQQIGLMFSVIIAPMLFFGCAYYPWRGLDVVPVMKYLVLINPMVYVAEGMRAALTPSVPHMPISVVLVALLVVVAVFWTLGMRSFHKRAIG